MKRTPRSPLRGEQTFDASKMSLPEIRALVYNYHDAQDKRKGSDMQLRHLGDKTPPEEKSVENPAYLLQKYAEAQAGLESDIAKYLGEYAEGHPVGRWMMAQTGIGPVIAAGYLAFIEIEKCPTVGHIWSFSGLNPQQVWEKGQKRPFSADMKQLAHHARECFKRSSNHLDSFYGKLYRAKKAELVARNERGGFAEKAAVYKGVSDPANKKLLAEGKVPPSYIDKVAGRYAVKIFLSYMHAVWYWHHFGKAPPKPFAISVLGHAHEIRVPNTDMFPGFEEAYYGRKLKKAA